MIVNSQNAMEILQELYINSQIDRIEQFLFIPFAILQMIVYYKLNQFLKEYISNNREYL